jgi:hypothetical protein
MLRVLALACLALLSACTSETLFRSNFDTTVGQPPVPQQSVGTGSITGSPPGSVLIVNPPVQPSGKWLEVSRPNGPDVAGFRGQFEKFRGNGKYTFAATMFMPTGSQTATIQFEGFDDPGAFLHIDFTEGNRVRIDDLESTTFGSFPRDQPFIVQVKLDINDTASTANIVLSGAGASGVKDHTILAPFQNQSKKFGAIRVLQGFPHVGRFDSTNISVTRRTD